MFYQHYKGGLYKVTNENVKHTETGERFVVYEDKDGNCWARPYDMFFSYVALDGFDVPRFTRTKLKF